MILNLSLAFCGLLLAAAVLWLGHPEARARAILRQLRRAWRDLRDPELTERDKERAARRRSLATLSASGRLALVMGAALLLPAGVLLFLHHINMVDIRELRALMLTPWFGAVGMAVLTGALLLRRRRSGRGGA